MHTFYYPDHINHDPAQLHRPDTPHKNQLYAETATRGTALYETVKTAALGPITPPGDFSIEPISDVHDTGMLTLLQTGFERIQQEAHTQPALPNTFARRSPLPHKPRHIYGLLGYYAFDQFSPIMAHTWEVAYWGAQTAISAAALVVASQEDAVSYALCRPPGHHVGIDMYGGYGYLNNAAIAANWLVQQGQRVAILDLDYHHGNGTQAIFYGRSDVLTCSIHADPLHEYPYYWGYADEYGTGSGDGFNFNFPLPRGAREAEYMRAFTDALGRVRHYVPDILVISLGTDIAADDPLGRFRLESNTFHKLGRDLAAHDLPAVVVQEGGYALETMGENVVSFLQGLLKM